MWPFRSRPAASPAPAFTAPDPVGTICRLLVQRWWEWSVVDQSGVYELYQHSSGAVVSVGRYAVAVGVKVAVNYLEGDDESRVRGAICGHVAARVAHVPYRFTDAAICLANAVKAGAQDAALALCDEILYHHNKPAPQ